MALAQKLQVAFIAIVLAAAAFFFYHNTREATDMSINSNTYYRQVGVDAGKPISATNPEDPKKKQLINFFGCSDGELNIIEYPNADPARTPTIQFKPETRGAPRTYHFFHDPMAPVKDIKDPFRHALALATYSSVYGPTLHILGAANMNPDQLKKELDARTAMRAIGTNVDGAVEAGTFHQDMMNKVVAALTQYKNADGDPLKNSGKAKLAWNVVNAAADFYNKQLEEKDKAIDTYMDVIAAMLTDDQKKAVIDAAEKIKTPQRGGPGMQRGTVTFGRGRGGAAPGNPPGSMPARGGRRGAPASAPAGR